MMKTVYLLLKHPPYPYNAIGSSDQYLYIRAGEVHGVFEDKREADKLAAEKNARKPHGLYAVHAKRVKAAG